MDTEEMLINAYRDNPWANPEAVPDYSVSEMVTVALAIQRYDLIPDTIPDPLEAYRSKLTSRQRAIVDKYRGWKR